MKCTRCQQNNREGVETGRESIAGQYGGISGFSHVIGKMKYVRGSIHTNNIEGVWSLLKRGIGGVYHSVSEKYLQN